MKLSPEAAEFARIRAALGWTQNEMADRIHKTQSYVSQVERGESGVEKTTMELLRWTAHQERPELFSHAPSRGGKNVISLTEQGGGGKESADGELKEAVEKLGELRKSNPEGFAAAKSVIYAIPKTPKKKKSKPEAAAG